MKFGAKNIQAVAYNGAFMLLIFHLPFFSLDISTETFVKFVYSENATKLEKISKFYLKLLSNGKKRLEMSSNFCGLLRI